MKIIRLSNKDEAYEQAIGEAAIRYELYLGDGWRCDFCEPNCDCDQRYLESIVNDVQIAFPMVNPDVIENNIRDWL